jgi:serine/threonine-protein kinase HipA
LCDTRPVSAREPFRQTVFAWLTGNGDLHAKNISVLKTPGREWQISPAYDLPSTAPYGDTTFALTIEGRRDGFLRRHLLDFAGMIGLPTRAAERVLDELLDATSGLIELAGDLAFPVDAATPNKTVRQLRFRRQQLVSPSGGAG